MKVIDNFLPESDFYKIKNFMMGNEMPWFYNKYKTFETENTRLDFQFTHVFYKDFLPNSNNMNVIYPLIEKINPASLIRVKANMTVVTKEIYKYSYHNDFNFKCKTAVYYINNNNGFTEFEDGSIVESKENRICIFDSSKNHRGTSCTDEQVRCLININFFEKE